MPCALWRLIHVSRVRARIIKIAKWLLLAWGGVSLVGLAALVAYVAYQLGPGNRDKTDSASPHDVRFVLNWCGLGDERIERVLHSHVSARSFTGDHLDAFAIKISRVEIAELASETNDLTGRWYRGDQLPQVLDEAVKFVSGWQHEIPWFPTESELRSSEFYIYPWSIYCHGVSPSAAELIFVRPSDKMVFYFGGKT
jgi:hypothetical protein